MAADALRALGNPFYGALDELLRGAGFDEFAETVCAEFYVEGVGRPCVAPGVYFRMLMVWRTSSRRPWTPTPQRWPR